MSMFPAYSDLCGEKEKSREDDSPVAATSSALSGWLENSSFALENEKKILELQKSKQAIVQIDSRSETSSSEDEPQMAEHKKIKLDAKVLPKCTIEFSGNEEFYVDKKPALQYKTVRTLHKPACPRYRRNIHQKLGLNSTNLMYFTRSNGTVKRYYRMPKTKDVNVLAVMDENDFTLRTGQLNRETMESPAVLKPWLELIELQDKNPYKWPRLFLAEKKLDLIQRALVYHQRSDILYRLYIDIISDTYPSFEVSKMLDKLLSKDLYNYNIWTAQIMTTQGSMARCIVPDVLRLYERCMQKMHNAQKRSATSIIEASAADCGAGDDEVLLKLFYNCALFLRQAGLYEQFFALLKLALELNVSTEHFCELTTLESEQHTLIEYEELILQSGLPMNEIWLRIEKLRQCFNFLPIPINAKCSDPQRIVFNEDVCRYIYPLKSRENAFYMILLILRLLKIPFIHSDVLSEKFCARVEHIGDSDAIEDVLAVCCRITLALPKQDDFLACLYELAKETAVGPTFLNNMIGHEIYERCLRQMLMNCAASFEGIDERKRIVFILLWCRFERTLLVMRKYCKSLDAEFVKAGRKRFKEMLKQKPNRNVINLYVEFAIYEFEALQQEASLDGVNKIFENLIVAHAPNHIFSLDLCHTFVTYAEILLSRNLHEEATQVLACFALDSDIKSKSAISMAKKLAAFQRISEKLDGIISIESNVELMILQQYLMPDNTVSLIRARILLQYLIGQKLEALSYLDKLLKTFLRNCERHRYLRECIQELYATVLQLPCTNCVVTNAFASEKIFAALNEFPRNLFLLQCAGMLISVPWYKIRTKLLHAKPSIFSIVFLISLARYRFLRMECSSEWDGKYNATIIRNRILNMFQSLTATTTTTVQDQKKNYELHRNALFWRLYLRCLSDENTAFDTSKKCLLTALDECPWSKALYLDGATYVPQELPHLQDLIIEKQLRICALPEELEILREK